MKEKIAEEVISAIENDIADRQGFYEREQVENDVEEEMRQEWRRLIINILEKHHVK